MEKVNFIDNSMGRNVMNCQKCGTANISGERFCKNCGCILENVSQQQVVSQSQQSVSQQPQEQSYAQTNMNANIYNQQNMDNNASYQQPVYNNNMNNNLNSNYIQQAVNPNMKKWAIISLLFLL